MSSDKVCHELKIAPEFYKPVEAGLKTFEIRKNDRGYKVGDLVKLCEFDGTKLTGRALYREIKYLAKYEQKQDYVVFSIGKY